MRYIATREGTEKLHGKGSVTPAQKELIAKLVQDYPDTKELLEYQNYQARATFANASALITMALDRNRSSMREGDGYLRYMATRPGAEFCGDHGLFSDTREASLADAMEEVRSHRGPVWTVIYSLRREDAARLGYDHADSWRALLMQQQARLAQAMKIPANQFRWYAAFHDEESHPHVHMMIWSDAPEKGHLTRNGVLAMRSVLTNAIFQDEMYHLYRQKDLAYRELVDKARAAMTEHVVHMETSDGQDPILGEKLVALAKALEGVSGKKQYGYLPKHVKTQVDSIVDALAERSDVASYYQLWNELRDAVEGYYKDTPRAHNPLSQQKEFRAVKNVVVQEAERLRQTINRQKTAPEISRGEVASADGAGATSASRPEKPQEAHPAEKKSVDPLVASAVGRLLYHMGRICRDNGIPPANPKGIRVDSRRRKRLMEKRLALGHKPNDHEDNLYTQSM